jgi:hypothetical protein
MRVFGIPRVFMRGEVVKRGCVTEWCSSDGVPTGLACMIGRVMTGSSLGACMLDMLRLKEFRNVPGSEVALLALVEDVMTDAIGSINSRSGLGRAKGAKSVFRKCDEAIRTVAAANEYDGRESWSGRR